MAKLIKCKSCGEDISKNAKVCPKCGEPTPKKTSLVTWLVLILFIVFIANYNNDSTSSSNKPRTLTPKEQARKLVSIEKYNWSTGGFGNILEADLTIKNDSKYTIKDIEITCNHYAKSGTKIDSNTRTIYDIVKSKSKKTFYKFNMGFIHSQAEKSGCVVSDFKIN